MDPSATSPDPSLAILRPQRSRIARLAGLSFLTGFSGAIMPGPMLALVIEQTTVQGWRAPIGIVTGHAILELILVLLLVLGLRTVLERPRVRGFIGLVGGAALLWMGIGMIQHTRLITLDTTEAAKAAYSWPRLMLAGALVCVANPYFTGWWATIGAGQLAHTAPRSPGEYMAFYIGHEASDYVWFLMVGALIITGRQWLTDTVYQVLIFGCGATIVGIGLWFIISGGRFWFGRQSNL